MKELISMVDYVLNYPSTTDYEFLVSEFLNQANFLNTDLNLGQFIACDLKGDVLEKPRDWKRWNVVNFVSAQCLQYQEAEKRQIFVGFELEILDMDLYYIKCTEFGIFYNLNNGKFTYSEDESELNKISDLVGLGIELK